MSEDLKEKKERRVKEGLKDFQEIGDLKGHKETKEIQEIYSL